MALVQWQAIDPSADAVDQALAAARTAAGRRHPSGPERRAVCAETTLAGARSWGARRAAGRVACVWWTDALGRRHWFIEGDQYRSAGRPDPLWRCRNGVGAPPLCYLAPRHAILRGDVLLVLCDCGAVGTPEAIAWTGPCCGPCHDRRQDGTATALPLSWQPHQGSILGLAWTSEGSIVSSGWRAPAPTAYLPETGELTAFDASTGGGATGMAFLPDDRVVVAYPNSVVACWDALTGEQVWETTCYGELMGAAASPLGTIIAVDGVTVSWIFDASTGQGWRVSDDLAHFAYSHDGALLYAFDFDTRSIVALDTETTEQSATGMEFGEPEEDECSALLCSPVGGVIASGGYHGRVRIGDLEAGRWRYEIDGPPGMVRHLAFTPDGVILASSHDDRVVFWEVATGRVHGGLGLPTCSPQALAFSPDGVTLAVGDEQGVVRLWPWRRLLA